MSKRDGSWLVTLEGYPPISTDDLTLDELEVAERACAVPYTLMDPHVTIRVAKALLGVVLLKANLERGLEQQAAEDDALKTAGKLTVRKLHGAFTYVPPTDPEKAAQLARVAAEREAAGPPSPAATSPAG